MATDLAEFHTTVSGIVNRGTKFDSDIVTQTKIAARWLEQNYSFPYMRKLMFFQFYEAQRDARLPARFKSIEFIRIPRAAVSAADLDEDHYLIGGSAEDFVSIPSAGLPTHYYAQEETDEIVLNRAPDQDYDAEVLLYRYTDWPTDTTDAPWLVTDGESVLAARALLQLGPIVRNVDLVKMYGDQLTLNLSALLGAEEERTQANTEHAMKMYTG